MPKNSFFAFTVAAMALLAACNGRTDASQEPTGHGHARIDIQNPTGECVAPDSGERAGYHSPSEGDRWLPDCQNTLRREYWRVFAESADSAYLIPRPDGAPGLQDACTDSTHALHAVVERHALCTTAMSSAQVDSANEIPPSDALAIAHHLHASLRFVAHDQGGYGDIAPFPLPSDIADACALHETASVPDLDSACEKERRGSVSSAEEVVQHTGGEAAKLAARLNELYGIPVD